MRPIIRCVRCNLNQFKTESGACRRCGTLFPVEWVPPVVMAKADPRPLNVIVAESVYTYRTAWGWRQCDFEKAAGISHSVICRVEKCKMKISIAMAERIGTGLRVPVSWVLEPPTPERLAAIFAVRVLQEVREYKIAWKADVVKAIKLRAYMLLGRTG